jgi:hypothetical protein
MAAHRLARRRERADDREDRTDAVAITRKVATRVTG